MNMHAMPIAPTQSALADRAVLANLNLRAWSARRYDRAESNDVNQKYGAELDTARVNKRLISKVAMARLQKAISHARAEHVRLTLPWGLRGVRILAVNGYLHYREVMAQCGGEFSQAKADFVRAYEQERAEAIAQAKGLLKADDYPETVADKFFYAINIMPVPLAEDFRVQMDGAQMEQIKAEIEASTRASIAKASLDGFERAKAALGKLVERMEAYTPSPGKGTRAKNVFRDSIVDNVRSLVEVLPMLNVFGDPNIDALAARLAGIAKYDGKELRESDAIRAATAQDAKQALEEISATMDSYL
jgi:hypothetical protein